MATETQSPPAAPKSGVMPWIVRGDIDGFFGLALDNLVQLLLIGTLCRFVLNLPDDLLYARILPGAAVSLLVGNLFYAWQARQLAKETGRTDVCALPYGINTVSLIGHVFLVMLPAKLEAQAAGHPNPGLAAWQAGLIACLGSGVVECIGAFFAEQIRRITPRAALLSTLAGIALTFISLGFLFRTFSHPIVGLSTFAIVMLTYFGRVRFKGGLPGGLVAVVLGSVLSRLTGIVAEGAPPTAGISLHLPVPVFGDLAEGFRSGYLLAYLSVIIPMSLFNVIGSLQNIESAEAAGDSYRTKPSLLVNGIGSVAAGMFGSCFPTTIYIGHPGWKAMGSRAGYSILNGVVITLICLTGTLAYIEWYVPIDAGMAIVLWIGIVITAQAFQAVPREHAAAVVMGLLPGIAAWGAIMIKGALRVAGYAFPVGAALTPASQKLMDSFAQSGTWLHGALALEQGFIFTSMILSAATVAVIERKFRTAALWCGAAALISLTGMMHAFEWKGSDTILKLEPAFQWSVAYASMAVIFFAAEFITVEGEGH